MWRVADGNWQNSQIQPHVMVSIGRMVGAEVNINPEMEFSERVDIKNIQKKLKSIKYDRSYDNFSVLKKQKIRKIGEVP